jgi:DNA-binding CsgD family transcriptional regulator
LFVLARAFHGYLVCRLVAMPQVPRPDVKSSAIKKKRASTATRRPADTDPRRADPPAPRRRTSLTPPEGLRASVLAGASGDVVVLSYPASALLLPPGLTDAEREVVAAVVEGKSNAAIAAERGRSARTVANQVNSVFRKLGVGSRAELVALCARASVVGLR